MTLHLDTTALRPYCWLISPNVHAVKCATIHWNSNMFVALLISIQAMDKNQRNMLTMGNQCYIFLSTRAAGKFYTPAADTSLGVIRRISFWLTATDAQRTRCGTTVSWAAKHSEAHHTHQEKQFWRAALSLLRRNVTQLSPAWQLLAKEPAVERKEAL